MRVTKDSMSDEELHLKGMFGLQRLMQTSPGAEEQPLPRKPKGKPLAAATANGSAKQRWSVEHVELKIKRLAAESIDELRTDAALRELANQSGWTRSTLAKALEQTRKNNNHSSMPTSPSVSTVVSAEIVEASQLLALTNIFATFKNDLQTLGYVADAQVAGSLLISHGATLFDKTTGFIFYGSSGSGKTDGILTASRLLPPEKVMNLTAISEKALFYIGDIEGRYIILGEVAPTKQGDDDPRQMAWRQLISENKLTLQSVEKGPDGKNAPVLHVTDGPCVIVAATTTEQTAWNDEFVNRQSWVRSDDSPSATEMILSLIAERAAQPWKSDTSAEICEKWQHFYGSLKALPVAVPFAQLLKPRLQHVTVRRLYKLVLTYTRISALLYQKQRQIQMHQGKQFVIAELCDYETAYKLVNSNAPRVLDAVSDSALKALEMLRGKLALKSLTLGEITKILNEPLTTTRRRVNELLGTGLIIQDGKNGRSNMYSLGEGATAGCDIGLIRPEELIVDETDFADPPDADGFMATSLERLNYSLSERFIGL